VSLIPAKLRIRLRAKLSELFCAYCHSPEWLLGIPLELDHIIPIAAGGRTILANLCLCCRACNGHKSDKIKAHDPKTGRLVNLFHPQRQKWSDHFAWSDDGARLIGLTATGRATIEALQMNDELIVNLRSLWKTFGLHPKDNPGITG
jgi:hypothetical protein